MGCICSENRIRAKDLKNKNLQTEDYEEIVTKVKVMFSKILNYTTYNAFEQCLPLNITLDIIKSKLSLIILVIIHNVIKKINDIQKDNFLEIVEFVEDLYDLLEQEELELIYSNNKYKKLLKEYEDLFDRLKDVESPKQIYVEKTNIDYYNYDEYVE